MRKSQVAQPLLAVRGLQIVVTPVAFWRRTKPHSQEWLCYKI
jgi:hypothetical protein